MPSPRTSIQLRTLRPYFHPPATPPPAIPRLGFKGLPQTSKQVGPEVLVGTFTQDHALVRTSLRYTAESEDGAHAAIRERTHCNHDSPLWWSCRGLSDDRKVVRSYLARRGRNAFVEALRRGGWDGDGRFVGVESTEGVSTGLELGSGQAKSDIRGTLQLDAKSSMLTVPYTTVVEQAVDILNRIVNYKCAPAKRRRPKKKL